MEAAVTLEVIRETLSVAFKLPVDKFRSIASAALKDLSVDDIGQLSPVAKNEFCTLLLSVLCSGITVYLPDSRDKSLLPGATRFGPHKVSRFFVPAGNGKVRDQVKELLTEAEFKSLTARFDLKGELPKLSELAYFWNSHDKARNRQYAGSGDKTTQQEDFDATGYAFGNDRVAVLFCARLVSRARKLQLDLTKLPDHWANYQAEIFNQFSEGERGILTQLSMGLTDTLSGVLDLDDYGLLRASYRRDLRPPIGRSLTTLYLSKDPRYRVFGSPRSTK